MLKLFMIRNIIQIGDSLLTEPSREIAKDEILSRESQELFGDMVETCDAERESTAGLSAVQIGIPKRVYVIRNIDSRKDKENKPVWEVVINPELKVLDSELSTAWEGCLSIGEGDKRLFGPVRRPRKVKIDYLDRNGKKKSLTGEDYLAHIIQHEQDHLDGKLFLGYIDNPTNIWTSEKLDAYIDKYDAYPPIQ